MARYAQIKNGKIVNVIVADESFCKLPQVRDVFDYHVRIDNLGPQEPQIGWDLDLQGGLKLKHYDRDYAHLDATLGLTNIIPSLSNSGLIGISVIIPNVEGMVR